MTFSGNHKQRFKQADTQFLPGTDPYQVIIQTYAGMNCTLKEAFKKIPCALVLIGLKSFGDEHCFDGISNQMKPD